MLLLNLGTDAKYQGKKEKGEGVEEEGGGEAKRRSGKTKTEARGAGLGGLGREAFEESKSKNETNRFTWPWIQNKTENESGERGVLCVGVWVGRQEIAARDRHRRCPEKEPRRKEGKRFPRFKGKRGADWGGGGGSKKGGMKLELGDPKNGLPLPFAMPG